MSQRLLLAFAACLPIALAGCSGGGGGTSASSTASPSGNTGGTSAPTTPTTPTEPVNVQSLGLDVIHLEMTDVYWTETDLGSPMEIVCPGVPPGGNECKIQSNEPQARFLSTSNDNDYSFIHHAALIDAADSVPFSDGYFDHLNPSPFQNGKLYGVDLTAFRFGSAVASSVSGGGGWAYFLVGDYSAGYTYFGYNYPNARRGDPFHFMSYSAAFGELHSGRPPGGSATWRGAMFGQGTTTTGARANNRRRSGRVTGDVEVTYRFGSNTVDVEISDIHLANDDGTSLPNLRWPDLRVNNDASFYIPGYGNDEAGTGLHPTYGYIDGDFYGPNAEEAAGVFDYIYPANAAAEINGWSVEEPGVTGAWLAIRD